MPLDVQEMGIDMLSLSAHKFHSPKGIGALYVRKGIALEPGLRRRSGANLASGTENVAGMVGLGQAIEDATGEHLAGRWATSSGRPSGQHHGCHPLHPLHR
ncbi:MAG: aminotransferase class V-fold PLP-dependent enzyme [Butyricicoccus sp.]